MAGILHSNSLFPNLDLYLLIFFVCTSCLLTRLVRMHSIAVSFPDYCLYAIITVISPHFLLLPYLHVSSQLTLRFVALNIVSV